jgi:hypothetical protein
MVCGSGFPAACIAPGSLFAAGKPLPQEIIASFAVVCSFEVSIIFVKRR